MKKQLITIAILCILAMLVMPVSAGGYVDNNPKYSVLPMDTYGYVEFFIRACGSAQDLNVYVAPAGANMTFDPAWRPDGSEITDQNKDFKNFKVLPDCLSARESLAAGEYVAYLKQGDGDQMEERTFKVGGGETTRVTFLGAAVSSPGIYECFHVFKILKATYGAEGECIWVVDVPGHTEYSYWISDVPEHTEYRYRDWIPAVYDKVCYPEVNHTEIQGNTTHTEMVGNTTHQEWVPEVNHTVTVIDIPEVPAWDEYVYHPEVNHTEWIEDGHYYVHDWKWFMGYGWKVKCSNHGEHGEGWHRETSACTEAYGHWITVIDSQEWVETIHHDAIPAVTHEEIVVDVPGHFIDVDNMDGYLIEVDNMDGQLVIVVDQEAYCEPILVTPAGWSDWSEWSDTEVTPVPEQREVETRLVTDDMYDGHYSEWSDTPEGSCMPRMDSVMRIPNEPCRTRWVEATYKQECSDAVVDVTAELQSVVASGHLKFYFDNTVVPGGIFSEGGELLVELADPAPQYPKSVSITYEDRCGNSPRVEIMTTGGSEQSLISLGEETTILSDRVCNAE